MNNIAIQPNLFEEIKIKGITTDFVANKAGVSTATIRNWIKTGYLIKNKQGLIDEESLTTFLQDVAGKEKLNSRANKSQKDLHNHDELENIILNKLTENFSEKIGTDYEESLSDSYRNKEGIYYTPKEIVADMLPDVIEDIQNKKFCDPSCGSGNFIMRAIEIGFKPENVYGFDIDPIAVEITKKRIEKKTGFISRNIQQSDFLEIASKTKLKFDFIYTNPPWGKKIQKQEKERYSSIFGAGRSVDTSSLFFFASITFLEANGSLGFLLPEAFFNIATFEDARKKALHLKIERLIDYGKSFKGLLTKAQAIVLSNRKIDNENIKCTISYKHNFLRTALSFKKMPKSILNLYCDNTASSVIEHVYSLEHINLVNNAQWGLGLVTGNNKKFGLDTIKEGYMPIYKGADITYEGLKEPQMFIPKDLSLYQQVAPVGLYEAPEKLIYKFISSKLCFFHDTKQRYILNSANMLILKKEFPVSSQNLVALLNSKFMNWLFTQIFNTHKILRGDIETLPIHKDYFLEYPDFDENKYLDYLGIKECEDGTYRIKG